MTQPDTTISAASPAVHRAVAELARVDVQLEAIDLIKRLGSVTGAVEIPVDEHKNIVVLAVDGVRGGEAMTVAIGPGGQVGWAWR